MSEENWPDEIRGAHFTDCCGNTTLSFYHEFDESVEYRCTSCGQGYELTKDDAVFHDDV